MSSTAQQAAASQANNTELTDAEKKRLSELQSQIYEAQARKDAAVRYLRGQAGNDDYLRSIPKDSPNYKEYLAAQQETEQQQQRIQNMQAEFEGLKSRASPELQQAISEGGKRSVFQSDVIAVNEYGGNILPESGQYHFSSSPVERKTQQGLANLAQYYPYATEQQIKNFYDSKISETELARLDAERARKFGDYTSPKPVQGFSVRPASKQSTSVAYEATLAARQQGFNVGSGLTIGLEETFQKEENKRFAEHNKMIGLMEGYVPPTLTATPQQPATVTPQNPRPHILTGQPASEYAAPGFAQKGSVQRQGIKPREINLVENINTITGKPMSSVAPKTENLSGTIFGIAPKKPRALTQEQVNALSPAEYAEYRKEFENYNQYVGYYNEQVKQQKQANILVNRGIFERNREAFAKYVAEAKAAGIQYVNIETKSGVQTVPIGQVLQRKGIIGISSVPSIPQGFTAGYVAGELIAIPEGKQFTGPVKPSEPDYVKNFGTLIGAEALISEKVLPKYYNEPGRVTSNEKLVASKQIVTGIENIKSPLEKGADFIEGLGTGLLRTSLVLTNVAPEAFMEIARTGNPLAGEDILKKHEEQLKNLGVGPSVLPTIETGKPTNRSVFYNVGELAGEVGPVLIGIKGQIKNPFSRSPVKPKVPQIEAPEIAKTPLGIKSYPVAKLRDQGYGERPTLERGVVPKEEFNIKKAMNIPEPFVQEAGTVRGAKDYGNLREQIENVPRPIEETTAKPVELEPFYTPKVEVRRAPEPNTFRVDESAMFGKDTATTVGKTEVPLGEGPLVKVEESKGPLGGSITKQVVAAEPFRSEYVPLGAGRVKEIRLNLGQGEGRYLGKNMEEVKRYHGTSKESARSILEGGFRKDRQTYFAETPEKALEFAPNEKGTVLEVTLNKRTGEILKISDIGKIFKKDIISKPKPVEEDVFYKPTLPKTRAKEIGTYRIQTDKLIGRTENPLKDIYLNMKEPSVIEGSKKPSIKQGVQKAEMEKSYPGLMGKKSFERSAIDAEKRRAENIYKFTKTQEISLGAGFGEKVPARPPPYQHVGLGRGRTFFVSRSTGESGAKRFQPPKSPPPESRGGRGGQELLLEKPSETKGFTVTKVELGSTEKVGLVGAGGLAVAPAPLLILAETDENGNPITNSTQGNGTITNGTGTLPPVVNPPQEIDLTPSPLEPPVITEARPASKFGAASTTSSGLAYGLDALNARRSKNGEKITVGPITGTKQKQETFAGFPNPSKQPSRLAQPGAFKQPQKEGQKFAQPFPSPQTPALKSPTPFPQPEKLKQPEPLRPKEPPKELPGFRFGRIKESKVQKAKALKPDAFVGNVSDVDIALGFNRKEITSGIKRSEKRYKKDILFAYKRGGFTKLVTQRQGSVLSKKQRSILEREKPKEVKRQKKKTGGFF